MKVVAMKTGHLFALVFLASLTVLAFPAAAQSNDACVQQIVWHTYVGPTPPAWQCTVDNPGGGFWPDAICHVRQGTAQCAPYNSPPETALGCSKCKGGGPIDFTTGNTYIEQADVLLPGIGGGLALKRTWNSMWPVTQLGSEVGMFGRNWRSTYEEQVFSADYGLKYARADGSFWSFGSSGSGWRNIAPADVHVTIVGSGSSWTMTFNDGEKRAFSMSTDRLTSIIDRNGNTTQLTYDGQNRLTTVTDPAGRTLVFSYPDSNSRLVSTVTSLAGTVTYAYDGDRLQKVTQPDGTFATFEYGDQNMITAVKDSDGKILEAHTYDGWCRGLTSTRADGVESISVSYTNPLWAMYAADPNNVFSVFRNCQAVTGGLSS